MNQFITTYYKKKLKPETDTFNKSVYLPIKKTKTIFKPVLLTKFDIFS